jgi:hypothetical protein
MSSSAAVKAFTGREGGAVCTSSNAAMAWAFERAERVLFLPDQHLGRNTAMAMGLIPPTAWSGTRTGSTAASTPTELNLVHRLATEHPDKTIASGTGRSASARP